MNKIQQIKGNSGSLLQRRKKCDIMTSRRRRDSGGCLCVSSTYSSGDVERQLNVSADGFLSPSAGSGDIQFIYYRGKPLANKFDKIVAIPTKIWYNNHIVGAGIPVGVYAFLAHIHQRALSSNLMSPPTVFCRSPSGWAYLHYYHIINFGDCQHFIWKKM